jgi:hypothetical protein
VPRRLSPLPSAPLPPPPSRASTPESGSFAVHSSRVDFNPFPLIDFQLETRERERETERRGGGECRLYAFGHSTPHSIPLDCHEERTISFFRIPLPVHRAPLAPLTSPSPFPSPLYVFLRNMKFLRALPYSLAKDRESYKASRSSVLPPPRAGISSAAALASGSFD